MVSLKQLQRVGVDDKNEIIYNIISSADRTINNLNQSIIDSSMHEFRDEDRCLLRLKVLCLDLMDELKSEADF